MKKIIERLKRVFDDAVFTLTDKAVLIVKHKGKQLKFEYSKDAYEHTIRHYSADGVKHFTRGISVDCIDEFMKEG